MDTNFTEAQIQDALHPPPPHCCLWMFPTFGPDQILMLRNTNAQEQRRGGGGGGGGRMQALVLGSVLVGKLHHASTHLSSRCMHAHSMTVGLPLKHNTL